MGEVRPCRTVASRSCIFDCSSSISNYEILGFFNVYRYHCSCLIASGLREIRQMLTRLKIAVSKA